MYKMFAEDTCRINRKRLEDIGIGLCIMSITFLFLLKSPLNLWQQTECGTDSSVFKNVAFLMGKGYMPYRDIFDHKGPLIYWINVLGNLISYYRGVWIVEYISLFITLLFGYKIARIVSSKVTSLIAIGFSVSLLFRYFEGGNLTEEYAMPFLTISLFIYIDYFIKERITKLRLIVCGFCFGAVCMLRPNMISVWIVFSIIVALNCIKNKQFMELWIFIRHFMCGICIIVIPIFIWLMVNHTLYDFVQDYLFFNMAYSSSNDEGLLLAARWDSFFFFFNTIEFLIVVLICSFLWILKKEVFFGVYVVYLIVTLWLISLSGRNYGHYGMILVPAVIFPIAFFLGAMENEIKKVGGFNYLFLVIYLLSSLILPNWLIHLQNVGYLYCNRTQENYSAKVMNICDFIVSNTSEKEKISVYGNWDIIYVLSQRISASKYSYQFPIGDIKPTIMDEYFDDLMEELPKIIVIASGKMDDRMEGFLNENDYVEILEDNNTYVYQLQP